MIVGSSCLLGMVKVHGGRFRSCYQFARDLDFEVEDHTSSADRPFQSNGLVTF